MIDRYQTKLKQIADKKREIKSKFDFLYTKKINSLNIKKKKILLEIKSLKKINKSTITNNKFLVNKEDNIEIYYAPFDYINSKAKIMIVGITPGLQQMLQSFEAVNEGRSLKEVKDLSSFKGSMRTTFLLL